MKSVKVVDVIEVDSTVLIDEHLLADRQEPVIIRGCNIGDCVRKWTAEFLQRSGENKRVKVHRSKGPQLDFRKKNFTYETVTFSDLVKFCNTSHAKELSNSTPAETGSVIQDNNEYWYLRSLGEDPRGKDVSDLSKHFPELYPDICIPPLFPPSSFFSSVFRITSPGLQLWTHYDTCHNILIQVRGKKRIIFFPPSEAKNLYLDGDKSSVLDVDQPDTTQFPKFELVQRYEAFLEECDIIFIPALWFEHLFHNVTALDFSISVNVFWKNLDPSLYDKKDTYGNRELIPAQLMFTSGQFPLVPLTPPPDNNTCTGITSTIFRRQIRRIRTCTRQLNIKSGHSCVLRCVMIMEGVLAKDGTVDQKLLDRFVENFPDFMQQRVVEYVERCRIVAVGKIDHKEESCKSYEPLYRCVTDGILNGFRTLDKAADQLKNLPPVYEDFYLRRMIVSLENRLAKLNHKLPSENPEEQTNPEF